MKHYEGDNIGGLAKIRIAFHTDFESFNPEVFKAGKDWLDIPFKEESGQLQPSADDSDNGIVYNYSGKFFIHRLRPEIENELNTYLGQVSVIEITDLNDEVYIIGAPGMPVTLQLGGDTGAKYTSENGAGYQFDIDQMFQYLRA